VYDLCDLKKFLETNKVPIKEFGGWFLKTKAGDEWTLALGIFYKNGIPVVEKELIDSFKKPKIRKKRKT
jgi:hypothetical protein